MRFVFSCIFFQYLLHYQRRQQQLWNEFQKHNDVVFRYLNLPTIKQINISVTRKETVDCNVLFNHCVDSINTIASTKQPFLFAQEPKALFGALQVDPAVYNCHFDLLVNIFCLASMPSLMRHQMHSISTASMMMIIANFSQFKKFAAETLNNHN